jgi:hypothetical protein
MDQADAVDAALKVVQQAGEDEVPVEVIAQNIKAISEGIKRLRAGRLNDTALVLLIQHAAPSPGSHQQRVSVGQVRAVLGGLAALEATYLKKLVKR